MKTLKKIFRKINQKGQCFSIVVLFLSLFSCNTGAMDIAKQSFEKAKTKPEVQNIEIIDNETLKLRFNVPLDSINKEQFLLKTPSGMELTINSVTQNEHYILLNLTNGLSNGNYELIGQNIRSSNGIENTRLTANFSYSINPQIIVSPLVGLTSESGSQSTFTVVLGSKPTDNVEILISSSNTGEITVSPATITFTPANWQLTQTVTLTGVDDAIVDGNQSVTIVLYPAISGDLNYNGLDADDILTINTDNDIAGLAVSAISGNTTEMGGQASFTIQLTSKPTDNVIISLSSSDTNEGTIAPATLSISPNEWNISKQIIVTGVDDADLDGNQNYNIQFLSISSTDTNFHGLTHPAIAVTNVDNETPQYGFTVSPVSGNTNENGQKAYFNISIYSQPTANVSISLTSSNMGEITVSPATITFTPANWQLTQTVTLTGVDDAIVDGNQSVTIVTGTAVSADVNYHGLNPNDITVINEDNDVAGYSITPISGNTSENGTTAFFQMRLNTAPANDVTIQFVSSVPTEGTVSPSSIVFNASNFSTWQTITITGQDDTIVDGNQDYTILITTTTADIEYSLLEPSDITLQNEDNDQDDSNFTESAYSFYKPITIQNFSTSMPNAYTISTTFDHSALVSAGKSLASGDDVRIIYMDNGNTPRELSRALAPGSAWNQADTKILFKTQAAIAANDTDTYYRLYYGNAAAAVPLADKRYVYDVYDEFDNLNDWTLWQDDSDRQAQNLQVSVSGGIVSINSNGNLLGGIKHKHLSMTNAYDFTVETKARHVGSANASLAPFIWFNGDSNEASYAYLTQSSTNQYVMNKNGQSSIGEEFIIDIDTTTGPFPVANTWYNYQLHRYTSGELKVWRNGSQQFPVLGGNGRGVKSLQTGSVNMNALTKTVNITPVEMSRAFVICSIITSSSAPATAPTCQITASDTVTLTANATGATVQWFVLEFQSHINVQRGNSNLTGTETTKSISLPTSVDLTKSFVLITSRANLTNTGDHDEKRLVRAYLSDTTTLQLDRSDSQAGKTTIIDWQVIELTNSRVLSGLTTIAAGSTTQNVSIAPVNPASAFVIFNYMPGIDANGYESKYLTRASLTSPTMVSFERLDVTGSVPIDISYFVIDMADGSNVQSGTMNTTGTHNQTSLSATIDQVNTALAIPFVSNTLAQTNDTASMDAGYFRSYYSNATTLTAVRQNHENKRADISYFAVEFAAWSSADTTITSGGFALGGKSPAGEVYQFDSIMLKKKISPEPITMLGTETSP